MKVPVRVALDALMREGRPLAPRRAAAAPGIGAPLAVLVLTFVALAYSEDFIRISQGNLDRTTLLVVDSILLVLVLGTGWWVRRTVDPPYERDCTWPWGPVGAVLTLALDYFSVPEEHTELYLGELLAYVVALALLVMFALKLSPWRLARELAPRASMRPAWASLQPIVPLLVGTGAAWIGAYIWFTELGGAVAINRKCVRGEAAGAVDQEYFAQVSQLIPLILIGVGIEARYFNSRLAERIPRATIVFTVVLLVIGEALALSALPEPNEGCGDVLHELHEYIAFIVTIEAAFIGLAMLVFALTSRSGPGSGSIARPEGSR